MKQGASQVARAMPSRGCHGTGGRHAIKGQRQQQQANTTNHRRGEGCAKGGGLQRRVGLATCPPTTRMKIYAETTRHEEGASQKKNKRAQKNDGSKCSGLCLYPATLFDPKGGTVGVSVNESNARTSNKHHQQERKEQRKTLRTTAGIRGLQEGCTNVVKRLVAIKCLFLLCLVLTVRPSMKEVSDGAGSARTMLVVFLSSCAFVSARFCKTTNKPPTTTKTNTKRDGNA